MQNRIDGAFNICAFVRLSKSRLSVFQKAIEPGDGPYGGVSKELVTYAENLLSAQAHERELSSGHVAVFVYSAKN